MNALEEWADSLPMPIFVVGAVVAAAFVMGGVGLLQVVFSQLY